MNNIFSYGYIKISPFCAVCFVAINFLIIPRWTFWESIFSHIGDLRFCCCLVAKLCLTLCNPLGSGPPGTSVHGILQARIMEKVAIFFPTQGWNPCLLHLLHWQADSLPLSHPGKPLVAVKSWMLPQQPYHDDTPLHFLIFSFGTVRVINETIFSSCSAKF